MATIKDLSEERMSFSVKGRDRDKIFSEIEEVINSYLGDANLTATIESVDLDFASDTIPFKARVVVRFD